MTDIFIKIVNMSVSASFAVVAVLFLRLVLKKAPKKIICALWGLVGLRLILPFSVKSPFSLIPRQTAIIESEVTGNVITSGFETATDAVTKIPETQTNANDVLCAIWLVCIVCLVAYSVISYVRLRLKVKNASDFRGNIRTCEISSPFVLGIIRPKIYLPNGITPKEAEFVIGHEEAHIKRKDHVLKPLAFAILALHWFNPLVWLGYVSFCRDVEFACDEKAVKNFSREEKADYSEVLLRLSTRRLSVAACPLAFGEVGVKARVKSVLSYKKPTFWIIAVAIAAAAVVGICFLTDPKPEIAQTSGSDLSGLSFEITAIETSAPDPYLTVKYKNETKKTLTFGEEFHVYKNNNGTFEDCRINDGAWEDTSHILSPGDTFVKTYGLNGLIMTEVGSYRFETKVNTEDSEHIAYIDFTLSKGVDGIMVLTFKVSGIAYNHPLSSYYATVENSPAYRLVNGTVLQEVKKDAVTTVGTLARTEISKEFFDDLFPEEFITENNRTWSTTANKEVYVLFEQKDGAYLLGRGMEYNGELRLNCIYKLSNG